jgi:hypothetical protein
VECVGAGGEVDDECLKNYDQRCIGSLSHHCDLACIRTPNSDCHEQCLYHYKVSTRQRPRGPDDGPSPLKRRQVWGR